MRLNEADIPDICSLDDAHEGNGWTESQVLASMTGPGGVAYGLKVGGVPVAFALFTRVLSEAELLNFGVSVRLRRRQLASRLLRSSLRELADGGTTSVHLEVRVSNIAAQALYAGFGFEQTGRRRGYYPAEVGREDALLLTLPWLEPGLGTG